MPELMTFFVVIIAGLFFSHLFNRLHLPWVAALIIAGIVIGPHGFGIYTSNPTFEILGEIGLIFLMFMAGLETRFSDFGHIKDRVLSIFLLNSIFPLLTGISIGLLFGYTLIESTLLGIIITSASIAVIIPTLEERGLLKKRIGKTILITALLEDVLSLTLLSLLLQVGIDKTSAHIPLPLFYLLLIALFISLKYLLPQIQNRLSWFHKKTDSYEHELRLVFVILIGTVILFESIGLEPIIAGFFTGMVLSSSMNNEVLKNKLHAISYGFFIPIFFVTIGTKADFSPIFQNTEILFLTIIIIIASLGAKFISGLVGAKLSGFTTKESALIGVSTIPHLSTALAVIFTGHELQLLNDQLVTTMITLTLASTLLGPLLISFVAKKVT